jgi:hypothetical protein
MKLAIRLLLLIAIIGCSSKKVDLQIENTIDDLQFSCKFDKYEFSENKGDSITLWYGKLQVKNNLCRNCIISLDNVKILFNDSIKSHLRSDSFLDIPIGFQINCDSTYSINVIACTHKIIRPDEINKAEIILAN